MVEPQRILLSGGSGFIGRRLIAGFAAKGHEIVQLVRRPPASPQEFQWDPYADHIDPRALKGLDAVVHLSGAGIGDQRWTPQRKRVLCDSRIVTTRVLAEHLADLDEKPRVLVSQSAIGIYGDRGDEVLTERSAPGSDDGFLTALTIAWERAAVPAAAAGIRVVHPRTGLVLERDAPFMDRLLPLFRAGLGGPIGHGRQWWSWISLDDVVRAFEHLLQSELDGPVNLVAPAPVRQREFAGALGSVLGRRAALPAPEAGVRLILGAERAQSIVFASTRVEPERLLTDGFEHADPRLEPTLRRLLS